MIMRFILYGLAGLCTEVLFTGMLSLYEGDASLTAKTYLWMFPIYASAIMLEPIHNIIRSAPPIVRGVIYLILIWGAEFASGWAIKKITGKCPWDYSKNTKHSFHGFIRWDYAPAWFFAGLLFEGYHDFLIRIFP
jgi:hypothetical protein